MPALTSSLRAPQVSSTNGIDRDGLYFSIFRVIDGDLFNHLLWQTINLPLPFGGYLKSFSIANHDPKNVDAGEHIDNIRFERVPDAGSTGLCLAFALGLLLIFRPKKENAWTS
jgi:hypothetical protein